MAYINKAARQDANLSTALKSEIQAAAVADIATPATATAEEIATKVNELLAALRAAGTLAE